MQERRGAAAAAAAAAPAAVVAVVVVVTTKEQRLRHEGLAGDSIPTICWRRCENKWSERWRG